MRKPKLIKLIGTVAITLGSCFTAMIILGIWGLFDPFFYGETAFNQLISTLGLLTVASLALLFVLRMTEDKIDSRTNNNLTQN